ncbi:MAG: hypothetical protein WA840_08880 [Caulobacteraceae bacterium]
MVFPLSIKDNIFIPTSQAAEARPAVLKQVEMLLLGVAAQNVKRTSDYVTFKGGPLRFVSNMNILVSIDYGAIAVEEGEAGIVIRYQLSLEVMCIIVTAMMAVLFAICVFQAHESWPRRGGIPLLGWAWIFGGNYLLTRHRFPRWLERGVMQLPYFQPAQ